MSYVEGSYVTSRDALEAFKRLKVAGCPTGKILLISNTKIRDQFIQQTDVDVTINVLSESDSSQNNSDTNSSLWKIVKDAFTIDEDYDEYSNVSTIDLLADYRVDISDGHIIVLVEEDPEVNNITIEERNLNPTDDVLLDKKITSDYDK